MAIDRKALKRASIIAVLVGIIVSAAMGYIAIDHNPQQEFYDTELGPHWDAILQLLLGWFLFPAGVTFLGAFILLRSKKVSP